MWVMLQQSLPSYSDGCSDRRYWTSTIHRLKVIDMQASPDNKTSALIEDPLRFLRVSTILSFSPGETIYAPQDTADSVYVVLSGVVKVGRIADNGREITLRVLYPDDVFGESAFVETVRSTRASALEECKVMVWTLDQIDKASISAPRLAYAFLQTVTQRLTEMEHKFQHDKTDPVGRRLIRALLEFAEKSNANQDGKSLVRIVPLTHEVLASYIGTSREVVTHLMVKFRRLGYVEYSRRGTYVYPDRLEELLREQTPSSRAARVAPKEQTLAAGQSYSS